MYKLTKQRLNHELNLVKIIKNLRNQQIIAHTFTLTKEVKNQIKLHEKNLLNLEDTSDLDSESSSELDLSQFNSS